MLDAQFIMALRKQDIISDKDFPQSPQEVVALKISRFLNGDWFAKSFWKRAPIGCFLGLLPFLVFSFSPQHIFIAVFSISGLPTLFGTPLALGLLHLIKQLSFERNFSKKIYSHFYDPQKIKLLFSYIEQSDLSLIYDYKKDFKICLNAYKNNKKFVFKKHIERALEAIANRELKLKEIAVKQKENLFFQENRSNNNMTQTVQSLLKAKQQSVPFSKENHQYFKKQK